MQVHRDLEASTPENLDELIDKMDRLQRQFEGLNGYGLEAQIEKILPEIGFEPEDGDRLVSAFSGGWQMRMSLGKILQTRHPAARRTYQPPRLRNHRMAGSLPERADHPHGNRIP